MESAGEKSQAEIELEATKLKLKAAFTIFDNDDNGTVDVRYVDGVSGMLAVIDFFSQ